MVKYFSVDWLAQSHHQECAAMHAHRPHVPCMVQPRAPTFGKSYLQPKPNPWKTPQQPEDRRDRVDRGGQEDRRDQVDRSGRSPSCPPPCELSGDSSGYESEAASSEGLSVDEGSEKDARQRRARTKFSPEQINKLEKIFSKHKYLDAGERLKAAQRLDLTETQVRTWFQNRRMKLKREVQDFLAPQMPPVRLQPLHPVRYQYAPSSTVTGLNRYHLPGVPQLLLRPQIPPHVLLQPPPFY